MSKEKDEIVERYLAGDSEASKLYAETKEKGCSPQLRDKILAESRKAVDSKPRLLSRPFITHGLVPFAIAATVLMGIGVSIFLPQNSHELSLTESPENRDFIFRAGPKPTNDTSSPEDWLNRIRQLRDEGKLKQAKLELLEFISKNKNHPIDELKKLLEE